jgi:putative flippase GtrA
MPSRDREPAARRPRLSGGISAGLLRQFFLYGVSGGTAALTLVIVLVALVELLDCPSTLASAIGFACATPVNYLLQHRFVFGQSRNHKVFFPRYVGVTLATLGLNTLLFWILTYPLGLFYLASQILTLAVIVPINFAINREFTFAARAPVTP